MERATKTLRYCRRHIDTLTRSPPSKQTPNRYKRHTTGTLNTAVSWKLCHIHTRCFWCGVYPSLPVTHKTSFVPQKGIAERYNVLRSFISHQSPSEFIYHPLSMLPTRSSSRSTPPSKPFPLGQVVMGVRVACASVNLSIHAEPTSFLPSLQQLVEIQAERANERTRRDLKSEASLCPPAIYECVQDLKSG